MGFSDMGRNGDSDKIAKRLTINLSARESERLERTAQVEGISQSEAARDAIRRDGFFQDRRAEGCHVIVKDADGNEYITYPN
jgi:cytidylate kinase